MLLYRVSLETLNRVHLKSQQGEIFPGPQNEISISFRMLYTSKPNQFFIANLFYASFKATVRSYNHLIILIHKPND